MRHFRVTFFFLAVALTLSGCGILGGSDGTDVAIAEPVEAQPTVNTVQAVPADTASESTVDEGTSDTTDGAAAPAEDTAALPTAIPLPESTPTPVPTVDRSQPTTYVVQGGDVLGLLAEEFDVDIADLREANNLDGNLIQVGQELIIPAADGSTTVTDTADDATDDTTDSAAAAPAATSAPAATVTCNSTGSGHCVQPGESLLGIALQYDVTVESVRAANPGITGDLIRSGEVINLPGSGTTTTTTTTDTGTVTTDTGTVTTDPGTVATVGPTSDADCAARNREFPYFHAADGLCYANPIGPTVVPTSSSTDPEEEVTCDPGFFLWEDGLCYPIPGATVTATPGPSPTSTPVEAIYGRPPCAEGYIEIPDNNLCWPVPGTTPTTPTPTPTGTAAQGCVSPNFILAGSDCYRLPAGETAGCSITGTDPATATCP